jgi:hypothetical protein
MRPTSPDHLISNYLITIIPFDRTVRVMKLLTKQFLKLPTVSALLKLKKKKLHGLSAQFRKVNKTVFQLLTDLKKSVA